MDNEQLKRLQCIANSFNAKKVPDEIMTAFRQEYGLAAEYMVRLFSMNETEYRERMDYKLNELNQALRTETNERRQGENHQERHHHHWYQGGTPCYRTHLE